LVVGARSRAKADHAIARLLTDGPEGSTAEPLVLDLDAGIMALPWGKTSDGFEQQWQVNVLGDPHRPR